MVMMRKCQPGSNTTPPPPAWIVSRPRAMNRLCTIDSSTVP